jgi:hypothetical protein
VAALPAEAELAAPGWEGDAALSARCHFLLRALPFAQRSLEDASGADDPCADRAVFMCDAPPPSGPLFDAAAMLALRCVAHPSARCAEAAHATLQAILRGRHPRRGALVPAYLAASLAAFPGAGAASAAPLAGASAAALRCLPPGDPLALAVVHHVATRAAQLQEEEAASGRAPGAAEDSPAAALRSVLFRTLLHVDYALLPAALAGVEAAVRRLRGAPARQAALDELCALLSAGTDHYRKRLCVDWCLRLAHTLSRERTT